MRIKQSIHDWMLYFKAKFRLDMARLRMYTLLALVLYIVLAFGVIQGRLS